MYLGRGRHDMSNVCCVKQRSQRMRKYIRKGITKKNMNKNTKEMKAQALTFCINFNFRLPLIRQVF